jgi:hypothetical protein
MILAVWEATLDERYLIRIIRTPEAYQGLLQILEGEKTLHEVPVGLAYDAAFGPDIDDVETWRKMAIDFIDSHEQTEKF